MQPDAEAILLEVLAAFSDADKWNDSMFEAIKRLSNTKVGDAGQDFVERLCNEIGFECEFPERPECRGRQRQSPWDIRIEDVTFELKTATEDVGGSFQFNHIRYHREYEALLCIGIGPNEIRFDAWSKAAVATGEAGTLVSMEKGGSASHKLTKRKGLLRQIHEFEDHMLNIVTAIDQHKRGIARQRRAASTSRSEPRRRPR